MLKSRCRLVWGEEWVRTSWVKCWDDSIYIVVSGRDATRTQMWSSNVICLCSSGNHIWYGTVHYSCYISSGFVVFTKFGIWQGLWIFDTASVMLGPDRYRRRLNRSYDCPKGCPLGVQASGWMPGVRRFQRSINSIVRRRLREIHNKEQWPWYIRGSVE